MGLTRTLGDKPGPGSGRIACPLPLRPFKVRGVFPDRVASKSLDDDASPAGLGPPPEYRAAMAPPQNRSSTGTLLGFRSLRHIQESRLHTGFGSPGSSRLGVSHPRERCSSCEPFRPYFMPERPWDSPFRALVPGNGAASVSRRDALTPLRKPLPSFSSEEEKEARGVARPQSFAHHPGPYPPNDPKVVQRADALLGSSLPRVFSPCDQRDRSPELPRASVAKVVLTGARETTTNLRLGALPEEG
jgi:hypothetical protein